MTAKTPFVIASVTKMYTAAAIMMLQEQGELDLDDKISKHLPNTLIVGLHRYKGTDYTHALTIRHLISHSSGFTDYFLERPKQGKSVFERVLTEGDYETNLEDVVKLTKESLPPAFPPSSLSGNSGARSRVKAHYSDTNYKLLGAIIESVTGDSLHETFDDFFFGPLNLTQTYVYGRSNADHSAVVAPVFYKGGAFAFDKVLSSHGPEGGIVSTIDDLLRFGQAFMEGELFRRQETLESMQHWNRIFFPLEYGYGMMRFRVPKLLAPFQYSPELVGHSGSTGSFLYFCKDLNLYMAGTINEMTLRSAPFRLMLKVANTVKRALR